MKPRERSRPPARTGSDETFTDTVPRTLTEDLALEEAIHLVKERLDAVVVEPWVLKEARDIANAKLAKRAQAEALGLYRRSA